MKTSHTKPGERAGEEVISWRLKLAAAEEKHRRHILVTDALARIRARALQMIRSPELAEVAEVMFGEFKKLVSIESGIGTGCWISIIDRKNHIAENWGTNFDDIKLSQSFHIPQKEHPVIHQNYLAWRRRKKLIATEFNRKQFLDFTRYLAKLPDFKKDPIIRQAIKSPPKRYWRYEASFSQGVIGVGSIHEIKKDDLEILKEFAKEFDLAHVRYLDLQKAEAHAREEQIEVALERIRAASMAMHKSQDLYEVIILVYNQLADLGLTLHSAQISESLDDKKNTYSWTTSNGQVYAEKLIMPKTKNAFFTRFQSAHENGESFYAQKLSKRQKDNFFRHAFEKSNLKGSPKSRQEFIYSCPGLDVSTFMTKDTALSIMRYDGVAYRNDENEIIKRIGKVFDQTYTRFLDLQKAEAQAREAQIEAALERVRAASMAMHKSEDLHKVINLVYNQLIDLGLSLTSVQISDTLIDKHTMHVWLSNNIQDYAEQLHLPIIRNVFFTRILSAIKNGESFFTQILSKRQKDDLSKHLFENSKNVAPKSRQDFIYSCPGLAISAAVGKTAMITVVRFDAIPYLPAENEIIKRFGKVFDQSYTRFLDLKKAEVQAREAQIEAALEKVRSASMAMHKSKDLHQVINVLYSQLADLGLTLHSAQIWDTLNDKHTMHVWNAGKDQVYPEQVHIPSTKNVFITRFYSAIKNDESFYSQILSKRQKDDMFKHYFKNSKNADVPKSRQDFIYSSPGMALSATIGKDAIITVMRFDAIPYLPADNEILKRFGKVFDQSYTRFLDLQKAEAQTRESRIEAALERFRARTMAMHKSQELAEIVQVLHGEMQKLNLEIDVLQIHENKEDQHFNLWMSTTQINYPTKITFPRFKHPLLNRFEEANKKLEEYFHITLDRRSKNSFYRKYFETANIETPLERQASLLKAKGLTMAVSVHKYTDLAIVRLDRRPPRQEEINVLRRFGHVFEQAYTRFLDLRKAEAQTREAQIEAALERIRAAAMSMHKTEELINVVRVLRQQMGEMGETELDSIVIHLYQDGTQTFDGWFGYRHKDNPDTEVVEGHCVIDWNSTERAKQDQQKYYSAEKNYTIVGEKKFLKEWYRYLEKTEPRALEYDDQGKLMIPDLLFYNYSKFENGALLLITNEEATAQSKYLLRRAADVFNLAYTRFLDLQKAEAQVREAQIEAALERVRARTMGMQKSEELQQIIRVVYDQFIQLDILIEHTGFIIDYRTRDDMHIWLADQHAVPSEITIPYFDSAHWNSFIEAKEKGMDFFVNHLDFEEKNTFYQKLFELIPGVSEEVREYYFRCPGLAISTTLMDNVGLYIENFSARPYTDEENHILKRFGKVFQQTYTRFLDLQKAENQAKEAQIEASLERVRAASMAMHKSKDLHKVINLVYNQLGDLGLTMHSAQISDTLNDKHTMHVWNAGKDQVYPEQVHIPTTKSAFFTRFYSAVKNGESFYTQLLSKRRKDDLFKHYFENSKNVDVPKSRQDFIFSSPGMVISAAVGKDAALSICRFDTSPYPPAENEILKRFGKVFDQSYTRFLDLKKAEAQARQAQIETSLERVRAQAMAMHRSDDLGLVATTVFEELDRLDLEILRSGIGLINGVNKSVNVWITTTTRAGNTLEVSGDEPLTGHPLLEGIFSFWQKQKPFSYTLEGEDLKKYYEVVTDTHFQVPFASEALKVMEQKHYYHCVMFPAGGLFVFRESPFSEEILKVLQRFGDVFHLAYTRYEDLQNAETRAQEAVKEASLDRVRGEIASMRTGEDLERITPLIWKELTILEIPFFRCGVFIIDESEKNVQALLTSPDGTSQTSLQLPFGSSETLDDTVDHWRKHAIFTDQWDQVRFIEWTESIIQQGFLKNSNEYLGSQQPPEKIALHFIPFTQGMLYVGSKNPLSENQLDVAQALADAFAVAYARYEDFNKLADAKNQIENTLNELQATQAQLIHSEKMASLGELTAGIAHEIQNPLNFVNNFSEVSTELIEEAKEELEKGDLEESKEILNDLIQNLEKINHHGQRASSIVKGMLDHSRTSSGEKVPTDINNLCDEYLRLAYHGMRAKDKNFNAKYETNFDDSIPKINIIPQDIGRVILNLVNNAFQAVSSEALAKEGRQYVPKVEVTTHIHPLAPASGGNLRANQKGKYLQITISDNGPGISEEIKDKIFQPFFTTKPTGQGTGLGLSLSYDIVKAHGGTIEVFSREEEGTVFRISIPAK